MSTIIEIRYRCRSTVYLPHASCSQKIFVFITLLVYGSLSLQASSRIYNTLHRQKRMNVMSDFDGANQRFLTERGILQDEKQREKETKVTEEIPVNKSEWNNNNNNTMSNSTVYVGGLHPRVAQVHLEKLMKPYGTAKRLCLCSKMGRIFAFCEYENAEEAQAATKALHGRRLLGNTLTVRPAHQANNKGILRNGTTDSMDARQEQVSIESKILALKRKLGR